MLTGLIAENTPTDGHDPRRQEPADDGCRRTTSTRSSRPPQSLMPEKILDELDADQVRDLMRYLQSDGPGGK